MYFQNQKNCQFRFYIIFTIYIHNILTTYYYEFSVFKSTFIDVRLLMFCFRNITIKSTT